ncbi:MAG: 6-pyruvoyl-tetrahydropterin synthase-related protein [Chloroflexota bacterium]
MLNRHKHLLLALLVACIAAWPLLSEPGLLNTRGGGDSPFLLQRVHQLEVALRAGHFPVRWMPDANYGYGYPFYNYYAPLSIYIAVAFRFLGFSIVRAIHLAQLAGFLVAAWGMFRLAYGWWRDENIALVASVAYTVAPFHLVNVYVRGDSLAEFWAMAFYPLILLAVDRLFDRQDIPIPQRIIPLGLAYAALIISHNISALIFSPFLLLYILLRARNLIPSLQRTPSDKRHSEESSTRNLTHSKGIRSFTPQAPFGVTGERISLLTIGHAIVGLLLAFALSAWFFVPALAEQSLAQLGPVTEGYFHYSNHFRGLDLVQTSWLFDYSVSGGGAFRMGLVQGITAVIGLILLIIHRQQNPTTILFTTLTFAIATFMITPTSELLWDYLPLLPLTQFPWRFLSVQAFGAALATAGLAKLPWGRLGAWGAVGITAVLTIASLATLETDHLILTDADITAEKLVQYEWFTGNIGTTVSAEYLPHNVIPRPYTSGWLLHGDRDHVVALDGDAAVTLVERRATEQTWSVQTDDAAQLIFPTLYWPGWEVWVDGERVESRAASGNGLFLVDVPAGAQEVVLRLARTPVRLVAELVSLTAVFIVLFLGFYTIIK